LSLSKNKYSLFLLSAVASSPVVTSTNSDLDKLDIFKENKGKSGIYRRVNKKSGKSYIGSSLNLSLRLSQYFSLAVLNRDDSMIIYKALLKYGYSNFSLEILEYCEPSKCIEREQYYIDLLKPEYNISLTARAPMTGRNHSELTKIKMSDGQTGEGNSFYGKIHNEETLKKMSEARKGRLRTEGSGRPSQKIEVFDLTTDIKTTYDSIRDAARALGIRPSGISLYFANNQQNPYKGRYIFKKL